ncbi:MAG: PEP-CTERM sorting domain-containing protein [Planctomycetales bacterium]|nr:PEP-CTERM sorting domain-containing protein [Planctomycetales bacterium]
MHLRLTFRAILATLAMFAVAEAQAQILYSQNFDADDTANWTVNDGATDEYADFFFDYSTVGIPAAPNSGGSTRGMRLAANIFGPNLDGIGAFGGFSVSPTGQAFTGDYTLKFDMWINYIGLYDETNPGAGSGGVEFGAAGSTTISYGGIMSSGNVANSAGVADGIFFAATGDGGSGADYRAYSSERAVSYQWPVITDPMDPNYSEEDTHAVYLADSRNQTAALYADNFLPATVPAAQTAAVIDGDPLGDTQYGMTRAGTLGFDWHAVEIAKAGDIVTWSVDGIDLITVDTANFTTPTGGDNILFGVGDINDSVSLDPNFEHVQFTVFDNIVVEVASAGGDNADFNGDLTVDGADFLTWQRNYPVTDGSGSLATGDANGDGNIDGADLAAWQSQFGTSAPAISSVPEPATIVLAALALCGLVAAGRRS